MSRSTGMCESDLAAIDGRIAAGSRSYDQFRYIDISPVNLMADVKYIIGVFYPLSASDPVAVASFNDPFETGPGITPLGGRRSSGSGFAFPELTPDEEAFGPNFQFRVVPIPAAVYLFFGGLMSLFGFGWRHQTS